MSMPIFIQLVLQQIVLDFIFVCDVLHKYYWATTRQNMSSGVSDQARHKLACAATEAS